jgi:hypothetical protein
MALRSPEKPRDALKMAKRRTEPKTEKAPSEPAGRRRRADIIQTSLYLPEVIHEALREAAFKERSKIHDIVMEGIRVALKKRGYPVTDETKPVRKG